jgi:hypothetical protein
MRRNNRKMINSTSRRRSADDSPATQQQADFRISQYRPQYSAILKTRFPLFFLAKTRFCEIPVGVLELSETKKWVFEIRNCFALRHF